MSYLDQITVGSTTYDLQDSGAQRVTLTGTSAPTTSTVGVVGQHYINTTATGHPYEYVCTAVSSGTYTWIPVDASEAPVTSVNSKTGAVVLDKTDIGLGNVDNVKQYSASNPPPYPVTSVNGSTGAVTVSVPSAATATPSDLGTAAVGTSTKWAKEDHVHNYPDVVHVGSTAPSDSNIELWLDNSSGGGSVVTSVNGATGAVNIPTVAIQSSTPSHGELVWIDTNPSTPEVSLPEIDDSTTSAVDTWSSNKIASEISSSSSSSLSRNELYAAGSYSASFALSDSVANYDFIVVYCGNGSYYFSTVVIPAFTVGMVASTEGAYVHFSLSETTGTIIGATSGFFVSGVYAYKFTKG